MISSRQWGQVIWLVKCIVVGVLGLMSVGDMSRQWGQVIWLVKGNSHMISPDRTRLISILLSNSRLPGHLSPDLWHSMLIILILLIHATTRQQ